MYIILVTGDFANFFYDKTGRDIEDGRLTWLIVNAYQRANPTQKKALEENYGIEEPGKADIVRQVSCICEIDTPTITSARKICLGVQSEI